MELVPFSHNVLGSHVGGEGHAHSNSMHATSEPGVSNEGGGSNTLVPEVAAVFA